jgi:small subunit ribosomal protein S1
MNDEATPLELPPVELPPFDEDLEALRAGNLEETLHDLRAEVLEGIIEEIEDERVLVRCGDDRVAVPLEEAAVPGDPAPTIGDDVRVFVTGTTSDGMWIGSIDRGERLAQGDALRALAGGPPVEGTIRYVTRRGFAVEVDGIRAFLPGRRSGISRHTAFDAIGRTLSLDVVEWDEPNAQLVVAQSRAEEQAEAERSAEVWRSIEEGADYDGTVVDLRPFGAIIEIAPGVRGLCHVSEIDVSPVEQPDDVLSLGAQVRVRVLEIQADRRRVALSRRSLLLDALHERFTAYQEGQVVDGVVRRVADFGAFIELERGVEGLCHVSELTWNGRPAHASDEVAVDQPVRVRILGVDRDRHRISLSVRQAAESPWTHFAEAHPEGSLVEGTIERVEDYGLFLRLADGITGLCHVSELAWGVRPTRPSDVGEWKVGDTVQARILTIDTSGQRVSLGIRQVDGDPWDDAVAQGRLELGSIVEATVTRLEDNAAWFEIVPSLEARMHISEMSTERIDSVRSLLRPAQTIPIMLIHVDRARRRIDASLRAIEMKERGELPSNWKEEGTFNVLADALRDKGIVD